MTVNKRGILFTIHHLAGLFTGLFILLMSLSGSVLIFRHELDQKPVVVQTSSPAIPVDSAYRLIRQYYPHAQISSCNLPDGPADPLSFFIYDASWQNGEKALEVFLHPQTGKRLGSRGGSDDPGNNFMSWLSKFHNSLLLDKTGEWLLGFFAMLFLVSLVTGLFLFRKSLLPVLLFRRSAWRTNNLHQLVGVYALLFNLLIAVTGFWMQRYVFKKEFYQSYDFNMTIKPSPAYPYRFDSAYAAVKSRYPDFTAYVVYFAQGTKGKTAVYGSRSSNAYIHSKKFADVIFLDSSGAVSKTRFINEISAGDRYDIINSQLHMGQYGGYGIKILYCLFGLSGSVLSITGFRLWRKRKRRSAVLTSSR